MGLFKETLIKNKSLLVFLVAIILLGIFLNWKITNYFDKFDAEETIKINRDFGDFITPSTLKEILAAEEIFWIYKVLNTIKVMNPKREILPLIKDFWDLNMESYPDVPTRILKNPLVRLHLADILIQAHKNKRPNGINLADLATRHGVEIIPADLYEVEINPDDLHEYVSSLLSNSDLRVAVDSILILSRFDKSSDVEKIVQLAKNEKYFRPVAMSLRSMCNSVAKKGLEDLYHHYQDPEKKQFIQEKLDLREKLIETKFMCDRNFRVFPAPESD